MTGIERLRKFAKGCRFIGQNVYSNAIGNIADQIEREQGGRVSRMRVLAVVTDMERHVSGVEGMEDSPVARWARVLREALGGDGRDHAADVSVSAYDLLPQEERDAIAWVRNHGGLERVKAQRRESMPRAAYERKKAGFLGHIAECETALRRRNVRIEELGKTIEFFQLNNSNFRHLLADVAERLGFTRYGDDYEPEDLLDTLDRRLMPEGIEWLLDVWPKWSNGEYCRFGDWWTADRYSEDEPRQLRRLVIYTPELLDEWEQGDGESYGYEWDFMRPSEVDYRPDKVEPPAPFDSWQRIEEDKGLNPFDYCKKVGHKLWTFDNAEEVKASDLVRRCRALAERVMDVLKTWEHAGMTCVLRHGALNIPCGYVVLPEGHPLHGVEYVDMDEFPDVHGGVTWTGELIGCHELGWLIGFDMGHDGDFEDNPWHCVRTDEECVCETNRLAEQMTDWGE